MAGRSRQVECRALELFESALETASAERRAFIAASPEPPEVRARALQLLEADREATMSVRTGGGAALLLDDDVPAVEAIGAYRVIRCVGRGGMGAVYEAERAEGDFEHRVAIKLIKAGALSHALSDRFRRERQLLARLNHPNIARLYDGGETAEGEPYIIMEYVEGASLSDWLEGDPGVERRLDLFEQICDAVEFAHQNLIVHRDLTPSNILVTESGAAKLIDFGIARPPREESLRSQAPFGAASATPGFAAPEQARGEVVNTLSDIFSLGRLLQTMTEGRSEPELEAIARKATRDDPNDRYSSVGELSIDLLSYRRKRPVAAFSDSRRYRFGKFLARQRLAVGATAAIIVLLLAGLGGTTWAYNRAETERAAAQQRFAETRAIARTMMFDVYDEVSRVPGSTGSRLLLARTAQLYLDSLAADESADIGVRLDAGRGYFRLAQVVGARTGGGTLGRMSEGKRLYERSRDILEALHAQHPGNGEIRAALGEVLAVMADNALFTDGDFSVARANARRARAMLSPLNRPSAAAAGALAITYMHEGNAYAWEGEPERAGQIYAQGIGRIASMPPPLRNSVPVRRALADLLRMTGAYHAYFARADESRAALERALAVRRGISAETRDHPKDVFDLVGVLNAVGQSRLSAGDVRGALAVAEEATELARQGMRLSPDDVGPQEQFTIAAIFHGRVLSRLGRHREAVALADEAVRLRRRLLRLADDVAAGPMTLAVRLQEASTVYLAAGRKSAGCAAMRESIGIMQDYDRTAGLPVANRVNNLEPMLAAVESC